MTERAEVRGEIIKLDYATLRDTNYINCKLVFAGGRPPSMVNCDFIESEFILEGPADATRFFLSVLAKSGAGDLVVKGMLGLQDWEKQDAKT